MCIDCGCAQPSGHDHDHDHEHHHHGRDHHHHDHDDHDGHRHGHKHHHKHHDNDEHRESHDHHDHHHHDHYDHHGHHDDRKHHHGHDKKHDGAASTARTTVVVETDILAKNNRFADGNRRLFREKGLFVLNLVSSPGSGKTTILERTLKDTGDACRYAVIEGDQQTDNDAVRIAATGVPVRQINTGAGCHLDAHMVLHAADHLDLDGLDVLMIENVGNLVCPASFDLGEHHKVVVLSVTEGEDKPLKYPQMFHEATVMLLNKIDLLPYLDFDVEKCKEMARRVSPGITIFEVSSRSGEGMDRWYQWLQQGMAQAKG